MIANLSPALSNYAESLSTLQFANRAKNIKNKASKFKDAKTARIHELEDEIERLVKEIDKKDKLIAEMQKAQSSKCKCIVM